MNWKLIDKEYNYYYRSDRLQTAKMLGFDFISETTVMLYRKHKSTIIVAKILGLSTAGVRSELLKNKEPLKLRGGSPSIIQT